MVEFQIICKLLFTTFIITVSTPYFQFNNILLTKIIHNDISSRQVTCLGFAIIVANALQKRNNCRAMFPEFDY